MLSLSLYDLETFFQYFLIPVTLGHFLQNQYPLPNHLKFFLHDDQMGDCQCNVVYKCTSFNNDRHRIEIYINIIRCIFFQIINNPPCNLCHFKTMCQPVPVKSSTINGKQLHFPLLPSKGIRIDYPGIISRKFIPCSFLIRLSFLVTFL